MPTSRSRDLIGLVDAAIVALDRHGEQVARDVEVLQGHIGAICDNLSNLRAALAEDADEESGAEARHDPRAVAERAGDPDWDARVARNVRRIMGEQQEDRSE